MHETLAEQEEERLDFERRKQNLIPLNVKEIVVENSNQRKQEALKFFNIFCREGLKSQNRLLI